MAYLNQIANMLKSKFGLERRFALVTGASQGLGRSYALELARRGIDTLLVALPGSGLDEVVKESRNLGVMCVPFEVDLCDEDAMESFCTTINAEYPIFMLINNAGTGGTHYFSSCSREYLEHILHLNVWVPTLLTRSLLSNLRKSDEAFILNVASMAAFTPTGFKTVYPATKCFILHFSLGLREELRDQGISVTTVTPGPMKTNEDVTRRIDCQGVFGRMGLATPDDVARISLKGLFRHKAVVLPGWSNVINRILLFFLPVNIQVRLMSRVVSRELKSTVSQSNKASDFGMMVSDNPTVNGKKEYIEAV